MREITRLRQVNIYNINRKKNANHTPRKRYFRRCASCFACIAKLDCIAFIELLGWRVNNVFVVQVAQKSRVGFVQSDEVLFYNAKSIDKTVRKYYNNGTTASYFYYFTAVKNGGKK